MVSKLVFKGDNKKTKSTRSIKPSSQSAGISKPRSGPKRSSKDVAAAAAAAAEPETVWSSAKNAAQITGPVVLTIVSNPSSKNSYKALPLLNLFLYWINWLIEKL